MDRQFEKAFSFLESRAVGRLLSLLPRSAEVHPAHLGDKKSARRGCRGRRDSAWNNVPLLSGVREARKTLLATQPSRPPGLETHHTAEEQNSHVRSI